MIKERTTDSVRLEELETFLEHRLRQIELFPITLKIKCFLQDKLRIFVEGNDIYSPAPEAVFKSLKEILESEPIAQVYLIEIHVLIKGKYQKSQESFGQDGQEISQPLRLNYLSDMWMTLEHYIVLLKKQYFKLIQKNIINLKDKKQAKLILASGLTSFLFLGGVYMMTRPCVFGECEILQKADNLAQEARLVFAPSLSDESLVSAQEKLAKSLKLLQSIPQWSSYYSTALYLQKDYQDKLNILSLLIEANDFEKQALSFYNKAPISLEKLEKVEYLWKEAIVKLVSISADSVGYHLVELTLTKYRDNLKNIQEKIFLEKQAQIIFKQANEAAKLAKYREQSAQNLSDLQLVYSTWETTIKKLQDIPKATTLFHQTQPILKQYLDKILITRKRKQQEEVAVKSYQEAIKQKKLAEQAQKSQQWSQSLTYWQQGLNYLKQVPKNTFIFRKSEPLITSYSLNVNQVKTQLKKEVELERIKENLAQICFKPSQVCQYIIGEKTIKVTLTSSYLAQVWNTALEAKVQGNLQIQIELLNHISSFEARLQKISNQTQKSIEVYNGEGNLMALYQAR
ncbi:hypothetical protein [Aphanothece sacrum]|uniref:Uncharacterized protein n=1 Tax=Aphanothece sacrum FPU1 TaxID=1920663 RepID=A0A401IH43_APHSA|nr:hypothetical protein [Aphanothece sacrum]GBF80526.1 hypothetical protein AsFPU1_1927 [Aphanothece sacrum FPU1]GBF85917.1 hypothetical protein AsFPU3_2987 [Aphanothece sacrum FPU3]